MVLTFNIVTGQENPSRPIVLTNDLRCRTSEYVDTVINLQ